MLQGLYSGAIAVQVVKSTAAMRDRLSAKEIEKRQGEQRWHKILHTKRSRKIRIKGRYRMNLSSSHSAARWTLGTSNARVLLRKTRKFILVGRYRLSRTDLPGTHERDVRSENIKFMFRLVQCEIDCQRGKSKNTRETQGCHKIRRTKAN